MPIVRADKKVIYYAHVPKCAGSAVEDYLAARFSPLAFRDTAHLRQPDNRRWTRTSPQHVDCASLDRLFPAGFFDHIFAVVRHPVARLVSCWHYQSEVERSVASGMTFTDWLMNIEDSWTEHPFAFDNHIRPMAELVPEREAGNVQVFHLEHGLDAIVPWLDSIAGSVAGPRTIAPTNERGAHGGKTSAKVVPSSSDLAMIERLYAVDFERFGYRVDAPKPLAPAPELSATYLAERDAELKFNNRAGVRLKKQVKKLARRALK